MNPGSDSRGIILVTVRFDMIPESGVLLEDRQNRSQILQFVTDNPLVFRKHPGFPCLSQTVDFAKTHDASKCMPADRRRVQLLSGMLILAENECLSQ